MLLFFYGYGISLDIDHIKIGLVLEDTSPDAISFAQALTDSRYFDVRIARDDRKFREEIVKGTLKGIVTVPSYFTAFRLKPSDVAPIQVISDGSDPNTASFVQNYVRETFQGWMQQESNLNQWNIKKNFVSSQSRFWFNQELNSHYFLIPGSLAIIMSLVGTLLTALVVSREWERGTMEALMATPVRISELVIGKLVPYFILGLISMMGSVFLGIVIYGIPFRGSFLVLLVVSSVFLFASLCLGLLLSTLSKNQFVAAQAALVSAFLPSFMLSGFIFEITTMPAWIRWITYLIPARYLVSSLQTLFLVGNVWKLIAINTFFMLLLGLAIFLITAKKTKKRL